jgi:eukaryotic-like serine/threonine-protein kinase
MSTIDSLTGLYNRSFFFAALAIPAFYAVGLQLVVADRVHRLEDPEGMVLGQEPEGGSELRRGGAVSVVVSAGPESVTMPRVQNLSEAQAVTLLEGDGYHFTVRVDRDWNDNVEAGFVAGQVPEEGGAVRQGSQVIINVSLGVEQVAVPDLGGMSREQAEGALAEAQLQGEFREEWSDEVPEAGMVVGQSVDAGAEVDKGTVVAVVVSRGPLTIQMPNVEGDAIGAARDRLQGLGLQVRMNEQPRPMIGPFRHGQFGRVEHQEPRPGESVRRGETVTLWTFSEAAEQGG